MDDNQNNNSDSPEIIDAEVVEGEEIVPQDVNVLLSLEEMIKSNIATIEKLQSEVKKQTEMFNDSFFNNPTYIENDKKAKEAIKVKSVTRQELSKQPAVSQLAAKIKEMRTDMKERQNALSDYLLEYQRLTGATQIEDNDGQIRDIVNTSKLIKRSEPKKETIPA